jgi:[ribosomal protein S5]-alanine N-acetyltransferase
VPLSEFLPEDSFFDFKCPFCGGVNSFPTTSVHTLQECASCGESIIVPESGAQTGHKLPLPLSTPRLLLRNFRPDDPPGLLKMVAEDESSTLPVTETDVDQWIESQMAARFTRSESGIHLAIELVENQELGGYVLPYYTDRFHNTAGFNLTIAPALRRQGLGLEAARAIIDFLFDGLCARRVAVSCPSLNVAGRRTIEKAGMRQEGEFIKSWFDGHDWVNMSWYAILKEERGSRASS